MLKGPASRRRWAPAARAWGDGASVEMLPTRRLNTPPGGPSVDSNAMVGPELPVVSATFDEVVSVQAAHATASAAITPRATKHALARSPQTTLTHPCDPARAVMPPSLKTSPSALLG